MTKREIQPWDTPYSRATSDWLRPCTTTAVITRRAFDTRRTSARQPIPMSCHTLFVCPGTRHCQPDTCQRHSSRLRPSRRVLPSRVGGGVLLHPNVHRRKRPLMLPRKLFIGHPNRREAPPLGSARIRCASQQHRHRVFEEAAEGFEEGRVVEIDHRNIAAGLPARTRFQGYCRRRGAHLRRWVTRVSYRRRSQSDTTHAPFRSTVSSDWRYHSTV